MIYAVIDVGSNSVRLSVYQCEDGAIHPMIDKKETVGLAGYVENHVLTKEGILKAAEVIARLYEITKDFGIAHVSVFATASLRNIINSGEVLYDIEQKTGIRPIVISGDEEAMLDFIGATHFIEMESGLLVDIGGGSTELVLFHKKSICHLTSLPIGSLNLYTDYVSGIFPTREERKIIKKKVQHLLDELDWIPSDGTSLLCGVGGTMRAFGKLSRELLAAKQDEQLLDIAHLKTLNRLLRQDDWGMKRQIYKIVPERTLNLEPGFLILQQIAKRFGTQWVTISKYGVREGYLLEKMLS